MTSSINVREAAAGDAPQLVEFLRKFREERLDTVLQHEDLPAIQDEETFIRKLDGTKGIILVAETDDTIIGCLTAEVHPHPQLRHGCEFGTAVLAKHRASGVGSRLIASLLAWARSKRLRRVELTVFANNQAAFRLYRRNGFSEEGRKRHAIRIGTRYEDSIQMALELDRVSDPSPPAEREGRRRSSRNVRTVTLRRSAPDDAESVCACVDAVARERRYLGNVIGFTVEETRSFIVSLAERGGVQIIALAGKVVAGWCDITPVPFEGMRHVGRLGMGLLPAYRGQGLGRRLLREVLRRAFAGGLSRVELEVFASNLAAIRLYEREGFVTEGRKRSARILDGVEDDILIMGLLKQEWARDSC